MGLGKLGLPVALAIESKGHDVKGYDVNSKIKDYVQMRKVPYREQGIEELLAKTNLKVVSLEEVVDHSDIVFVAVQTPHDPKFEGITRLTDERKDFDYSYLINAIKQLSEVLDKKKIEKIVVIISTVLPQTIEEKVKPVMSPRIKLCYNPFFIAMGTTVPDFLNPEFILFGVDDKEALMRAKEFYRTITSAPVYETSIRNAELIKVAYNTFIGMKIVFANTIMEICQKTGADADAVVNGLSLANRRLLSPSYMYGGMGDGGGCHPRDNIALSWLSKKLNLKYDFFESLMVAREKQTEYLANIIKTYDLPKVILGKAYKPETNLTVGSPSILLKNILEEQKVNIKIYDPHVDTDAKDLLEEITSKPHLYFIGTKHGDFVNFNYANGSVIIDPFRYIPDIHGVKVVRIGEGKNHTLLE